MPPYRVAAPVVVTTPNPCPATACDPAKNVAYAARFLSELKEREGTWTKAVARYHAGPKNLPAQKAYVCRVIGNMVAAGVGEWTSDARAYCGR